ncbi:MAG: Bifunctional protein pyrR [Phycisphaerae bacterium]|nr:Bifunctional protein pyrR [Phycisphaerae bacterium]
MPKKADNSGSAGSEETLLDAAGVKRAMDHLCREIAGALPGDCPVAIIGLRSRGDELAARLIERLAEGGRGDLLHGTLDITLYRDDVSKRMIQPQVRATVIDFDLDDACVVLVDDVLHTGRTIRAAMDALMDYGRPAAVRLAVLVDRGGREMPICPDFVGKTLKLSPSDSRRVYLDLAETDGADRVYLK